MFRTGVAKIRMFALKDEKILNNNQETSKSCLLKTLLGLYKKLKFIAKYEYSMPDNDFLLSSKISIITKIDKLLSDYLICINNHPEVKPFQE